jgi:hypothetical protein
MTQANIRKLPLPALNALGLHTEHLTALAKNGSLCAEVRDHGRVYYRLRFRMGTKQQHTRYVGNAPEFVEQVRGELKLLQAKERARRGLRQLAEEARRIAQDTKHLLEPLLPSAGRVFHGCAIRRRRTSGSDRSVCLD